ncbi:hypothetical protein PHMEG_00018183 [Phytophthora megakarya]|uniref:Uncharacterized protein n=1 Tax=Phytophthora megakarya TaxID=4795 RepID=A0A225VWH5_9STRA|nr:hypothetical protein PHMEG_00018183 [Phytophthora megakarya]
MAPDLNTGSAFGFEEIARNWGILGLFFHNVLFKVDDITQITDNVLIAKTTTRMTITARTLREAFLFSTHTVDEGRWLRIVNKLLGQRVVMLGSVRFIWNNSTNLLDGLFSQADLIMPLFQLLGNIEDVSTVLSNARVTPEGNLVVGDYLMQYPLYS